MFFFGINAESSVTTTQGPLTKRGTKVLCSSTKLIPRVLCMQFRTTIRTIRRKKVIAKWPHRMQYSERTERRKHPAVWLAFNLSTSACRNDSTTSHPGIMYDPTITKNYSPWTINNSHYLHVFYSAMDAFEIVAILQWNALSSITMATSYCRKKKKTLACSLVKSRAQ